ncbi:MAG: hypothetical protein PHD02_02565, partial [Bacilli bacterium]|nr:hypothetical protein [Bacilli bacterium]
MDNLFLKGTNLFLSTTFFDEVYNDSSIKSLCNDVKTAVESNQFEALSNCGLFVNGLNSIVSSADAILEYSNSFKASLNNHKENIVDEENYLATRFDNLEGLEVLSTSSISNDGMTEEESFDGINEDNSQSYTSKYLSYEQFKLQAQQFAIEQGLPQASDEKIFETYQNYLANNKIDLSNATFSNATDTSVSTDIGDIATSTISAASIAAATIGSTITPEVTSTPSPTSSVSEVIKEPTEGPIAEPLKPPITEDENSQNTESTRSTMGETKADENFNENSNKENYDINKKVKENNAQNDTPSSPSPTATKETVTSSISPNPTPTPSSTPSPTSSVSEVIKEPTEGPIAEPLKPPITEDENSQNTESTR